RNTNKREHSNGKHWKRISWNCIPPNIRWKLIPFHCFLGRLVRSFHSIGMENPFEWVFVSTTLNFPFKWSFGMNVCLNNLVFPFKWFISHINYLNRFLCLG
ncbi:hypothetical protein TorRG33x02_005930, partial [Trema orientale]